MRALLALPRRRGQHAEHPTLCGRCVSNLYGAGETRTTPDGARKSSGASLALAGAGRPVVVLDQFTKR
jgi:hypothetical protein